MHTKGPWNVANFHSYDKRILIPEAGCEVDYDDCDRAEAEANARLIAAAPDMYEALRAVVAWCETPQDHGGNPYCKKFVHLAQDALAKAEGAE